MNGDGAPAPATDFVDRAASYWERAGLSRAAGAILGFLMVCEPAAKTQAEIAAALTMSAGSVSTQLSFLAQSGLVERVRTAGERSGRYQMPMNLWTRILLSESDRIAGLRELAEGGLAAMPVTRTDRVTSLDAMVRFWEAEWPALEARFEDFVRKDER